MAPGNPSSHGTNPLMYNGLRLSGPSSAPCPLNQGLTRAFVVLSLRSSAKSVSKLAHRERKFEGSVTGAILQEMEEKNEEKTAWERLLNHMEDSSRPPTLVHHQVRQTSTDIRRSRVVRRSASFAGLNSQVESRNGDRGSVMEAVFQLRQVWSETIDITPDFDERSDEEY
ncbi:uncharacterized protein BJ212DRAFT_1479491 [Suillus subaureus]|uniref:Uncharacterized protein n=1 Tax=Suillus subaureus TaxID=48587 RepID=A0A9P7EDD0_9AGAM|nr:uncharacterized protein BJ212DRAFT_1479491 [Suillus subaureus]KAG1818483.1 hypothetical protein BJ212DRAFT_1479491 [Suillus subaureus]